MLFCPKDLHHGDNTSPLLVVCCLFSSAAVSFVWCYQNRNMVPNWKQNWRQGECPMQHVSRESVQAWNLDEKEENYWEAKDSGEFCWTVWFVSDDQFIIPVALGWSWPEVLCQERWPGRQMAEMCAQIFINALIWWLAYSRHLQVHQQMSRLHHEVPRQPEMGR